ncbi:hypothetical protein L210DRAFT_3538724 [Boletus edulis BED1]|uniref:Uncharacterized protein n=1 Tax=Boletus edulis BED1 TaxID=1328754 RepID=A0AAD4BVN0_BOLED|nr:hypothetical protein L210DRAFT_3538724 [Boletus edulis BED1]
MESYSSVSYPSLPFFLTSKKLIFMESMEDVLSNTQSHSLLEWLRLVQQHDPNEGYVVTAVRHYKERHFMQREYIVLSVHLRPPEPTAVPTILCISRTIIDHTLSARVGLWGPAYDTVAVEGPADQFHPGDDKLLYRLNFSYATAPSLHGISRKIYRVHAAMPRYHLIKYSCYSFALAVRRTIELIYDGVNGAQLHDHDSLIRQSHLLRLIPTPTSHALKTAWDIACSHWIENGMQDGNGMLIVLSFIGLLLTYTPVEV